MATSDNTVAEVSLWGRRVGAVSWDSQPGRASFEYDKDFQESGIEIAPFHMPLGPEIYSFPALGFESFKGLPGLLADSLPDDFGNKLINTWLAQQGREPDSLNSVERLCYIGSRAMGALEYAPVIGERRNNPKKLDVSKLVELASDILSQRDEFKTELDGEDSMNDILRVGTSAGGARAKAIIAWNEESNEVRSGQSEPGDGFSHWILKLDGVSNNKDKEVADPKGYGRIEYAYYLMAKDAGINMAESRLHEENGRAHFMTKRFDRTDDGLKIHMQTLAALEHFDYRMPGAYSYEQALMTIRKLGLPLAAVEQQLRRAAFNIIARNQDDHVKNISFLMNPLGEWILSPAYDVTFSYNPNGAWTGQHQMSLNGKRDHFTIEDFRECAANFSLKRGRIDEIVEEVQGVVMRWEDYGAVAGLDDTLTGSIQAAQRCEIVS